MIRVKKILYVIVLLILGSCSGSAEKESGVFDENADYIQVVLFHLEQRCASCRAVESETMKFLEEEYSEETEHGKLKFIVLSIQSGEGKRAAALLKAGGQNLFVVKGDSISDLSGPAFLFAGTHPERYRNVLGEEIDKFLE